MANIYIGFKPEGTYTDPTSIEAGWSSADYGVKRDDTGATVVDAGTALTKVATGQYKLPVTEPAAGLDYTYHYKLVYDGKTLTESGAWSAPTTTAGLELEYSNIYKEVSRYLGTGGDPSGTDLTRAQRISQDAWREMLVGFIPGYDPPQTYEWSFLDTPATLTIAAGSTTTALPTDFESMSGPLAFAPTETATVLQQRDPGVIDQYYAEAGTGTGTPVFFAIEPVGFSASAVQRRQIKTWPAAGSTTTFYYHYRKTPDALSQELMGQPTMHMALKQLARAVAAEEEDDISPDANPERAKADRLILSAMYLDARNKPQSLGYNRDNSDQPRPQFDRLGTQTYET